MGTTSSHAIAAALIAATLTGPACSRQATDPTSSSAVSAASAILSTDSDAGTDASTLSSQASGLVDLSLNRLTRVEGTFRIRITLTGQEPGEWQEFPFTRERQIIGTQTPEPGGPEYRAERATETSDPEPVVTIDLWRQDRSGLFLYQSDVSSPSAPLAAQALRGLDATQVTAFDRALRDIAAKRDAALGLGLPAELTTRRSGSTAFGVGPHEITFLLYPLRPGATWEGRPGFNVWTVEALETIASPAGRFHTARLRIEVPDFFGPEDVARTWWGVPGEVKREFHFVTDATDENGTVIGRVEDTESFLVTAYQPNAPL
jgi:hypothetical protein